MEGATVAPPLANHPGTGLHTQAVADVPPGHVWLGGDNLAMSTDSRDYGPVPKSLLVGRLTAQVRLTIVVAACLTDHFPGQGC